MRYLIAIFLSWNAQAEDCSERIRGFNFWDARVKGQIVEKVSIAPLTDWTTASEYQGVLITKKAGEKPMNLSVRFTPQGKGAKVLRRFGPPVPFVADAKYLHFADFKPRDFFRFEGDGQIELILELAGKSVCSLERKYLVVE